MSDILFKKIIDRDLVICSYAERSSQSVDLLKKCIDCEQVVFEQGSDYYFFYATHNMMRSIIKTKSGNIFPLAFNDGELILFFPLIIDWDELAALLKKWELNFEKITINYYSESQADRYNKNLKALGFNKKIRSANEVFYSIKKLSELSGKEFERLRYKKNKLNRLPGYELKALTTNNLDDASSIIERWNIDRSHIYKKDRSSKELNYLKMVASSKCEETKGFLLYHNNIPVGILSLDFRYSQNTVCTTILKGINRGPSGDSIFASDYLYFSAIDIAQGKSVDYINDGEIGLELGTKAHKSQFRPVMSRKVYDYVK